SVAAARNLHRTTLDSRLRGVPRRHDCEHRRARCATHTASRVARRCARAGVVMNRGISMVRPFDPALITTLLCDADDNLFPSERPAFGASVELANLFLETFGVTAPL